MKLSKSKLIKLVKPDLEKLGYVEFKDSFYGYQGLFAKKIEEGMYLTLGLVIHRFFESAFTAEFYLSKTTRISSIWGDIPRESSERPGFLLTEVEIAEYPADDINVKGSSDIWWDGNDASSVSDFLHVIQLVEPRFLNLPGLIAKINQSAEVNELSRYAEDVKQAVFENKGTNDLHFQPAQEIDGVPMVWFSAAEAALKKHSGILNANTVKLLAADAYRQYQLDKS